MTTSTMTTDYGTRSRIVAALAGQPRMERERAAALVTKLRARVYWRPMHAFVDGDRVVFTGGAHGEHSIALDVSTPERIIAHFLGYLAANGYVEPNAGDVVRFPSASAASGERAGRVLRRTSSRALVAYKFKSGKQAAPKWMPLWKLVFVRRSAAPVWEA